MNNNTVRQFSELLTELHGKECWSITAGPTTGSMINLSIGNKVKRERQLTGMHLSEDEKLYQGEYGIYIEFSAWRLESGNTILCNSEDDPSPSGLMVKGLEKLLGKKIVRIEMDLPFRDLRIYVANDLTLRIFAFVTDRYDSVDNYSIFKGNVSFIVGPNGIVYNE